MGPYKAFYDLKKYFITAAVKSDILDGDSTCNWYGDINFEDEGAKGQESLFPDGSTRWLKPEIAADAFVKQTLGQDCAKSVSSWTWSILRWIVQGEEELASSLMKAGGTVPVTFLSGFIN